MGTAFLALRQAPDGLAPVVIKMVRPGFGATGPADAAAGMLDQSSGEKSSAGFMRVMPWQFTSKSSCP